MGFQLPLYIKDPVILEYTSNSTWTKQPGLIEIIVVCVGAGGNGSSSTGSTASAGLSGISAMPGGGGGGGITLVS